MHIFEMPYISINDLRVYEIIYRNYLATQVPYEIDNIFKNLEKINEKEIIKSLDYFVKNEKIRKIEKEGIVSFYLPDNIINLY